MKIKFRNSNLLGLLIVLSIVLAIAAFFGSEKYNKDRRFSRRTARINSVKTILEKTYAQDMEVVYSIKNFFLVKHQISKDEFKKFVAYSLERHPEIQALEYMFKLPHAKRAEYEKQRRSEGAKDFFVKELTGGQIQVAGNRPDYHVIHYAEPYEENKMAVGYDISFTAPAREALDHAKLTGLGVSPWLNLAQGDVGFVVYAAISDSDHFAVGVFRLKKFIEAGLKIANVNNFDFVIEQVTNGSVESKIFKYDAGNGVVVEISKAEYLEKNVPNVLLNIDNQTWRLTYSPQERRGGDLRASFMFSMGVLIFSLLCAFLFIERDARIKAQAEAKVREDFVTIVSHELRTPLTPLKMELFLLQEMIGKSDQNKNKIEKLFENANKQVNHVVSLIDDLLDMGKIRSGNFAFQFSDFNLTELIKATTDRFKPALQSNGCELKLNLQEDVIVHWDPRRIEQVITNCLSNSMKFAVGRPVEITLKCEGDIVHLSVKDYGMGIDPEFQKKIFDRFERGVSTRSYGGIGIGLYIVREIVHAHAGEVSVQSQPGLGAEFIFKVPKRV